ncbi:MAG TPA: pyruvate dehydrogenase (acetyl-transferring) E1 component subunit alpha [Candidatus Omnitrophica bacterium]|nr:pyruvate dehydrogenase (acetyl-transferring) E1 component subunit alpha [Candidatus Omnitrophota bacterium]
MGESREELIGYLKKMLQIRYFEEKVYELLAHNIIKGASHLYVGEEAVAVGACSAIKDDDYITSTHRGHGHCLAKGGDLSIMMAELCGKTTGYCKGRGGSMHIADVTAGNLGATGIVGSNIPVAVGAALSCKMQKNGKVVLCFFGDGATNQGVFHESMNIASLWKLPVVFICENNLYGMSVSTVRCSSIQELKDKGKSHNVEGIAVDGMDVLTVKRAVEKAVKKAREGGGPTLIECKTYRFFGHSRSDPRVYRTREEEKMWKERDPINRFKEKLIKERLLSEKEYEQIEEDVEGEIEKATQFAINSSYPKREEIRDDIYAPSPEELVNPKAIK